MDNPSGSRTVWGEDGKTFWLYASNANGVMNNAVIAVITPTFNTFLDMLANPGNYENKWIYLSGEHYGSSFMGHGMFYWLLVGLKFSPAYALQTALDRAPDGFYLRLQ